MFEPLRRRLFSSGAAFVVRGLRSFGVASTVQVKVSTGSPDPLIEGISRLTQNNRPTFPNLEGFVEFRV